MSDDTDDLLDFGTLEVYYIVWYRQDGTYYLADMSPDLTQIEWTKNSRKGFYFYTDTEAKKHKRHIGKSRHGIGIEPGEIDLVDEINLTHDVP